MSGILYVVGTPIGNMGDVTIRALKVLGSVELILCEDTRVTSKLINHYIESGHLKSKPRYMAYNDFNEKIIFTKIADRLEAGENVGLVSDAGMPLISDPGYRVVRECFDRGIHVEIIPGPSSVSAAIALSGLGGKNYIFLGYLPKKSKKRDQLAEAVNRLMAEIEDIRVVVFVTPHKIKDDVAFLSQKLGSKRAVLLREMTKKFEERIEGELDKLGEVIKTKSLKGEAVLVIANS